MSIPEGHLAPENASLFLGTFLMVLGTHNALRDARPSTSPRFGAKDRSNRRIPQAALILTLVIMAVLACWPSMPVWSAVGSD
jgi:hypothetical protein